MMPQPFTDADAVSAEEEIDAEFVDADLEALIEAELLIDDHAFEGLGLVY
jgi:hypothetical protein